MTFNAALISAIDRVLMSDLVVVLSFQECISKYLYAYTVCTLCSVYVCVRVFPRVLKRFVTVHGISDHSIW